MNISNLWTTIWRTTLWTTSAATIWTIGLLCLLTLSAPTFGGPPEWLDKYVIPSEKSFPARPPTDMYKFDEKYNGGFKHKAFKDLPTRYKFFDWVNRRNYGHNFMMSATGNVATLNFLPDRDLNKREMQDLHEAVCRMARKWPDFTLTGTAFYLPGGLLYGSPCVRPDGKGMDNAPYGKWDGKDKFTLPEED